MRAAVKTIASQPSWVIRNKDVELALTHLGGHMAPVSFYRNTRTPVQPYYISPWQGEALKIHDPVLVPLRGDFFCMPFGANTAPYNGEQYSCHGEPACKKWQLADLSVHGNVTSLTTSINTHIRPGKVTKTLSLVAGQNVVYSRNLMEGLTGRMPIGHHPTLALPEVEGALRVSTSRFVFGMTNPTPTADPKMGQYQSFLPGGRFTDLSRVPLAWKTEPIGDCTAFPVRQGFDDLLSVFKEPGPLPAWTTAVDVAKGFLWFSLKDPAILPATVFWISNRGHHDSPLLGRNRCLGMEDVCGYFAEGIVDSLRNNVINRLGFPTAVNLSPKTPTAVNYIQGVVKIPQSFQRVGQVEFAPGNVTFIPASGKEVSADVCWDFIKTGMLS